MSQTLVHLLAVLMVLSLDKSYGIISLFLELVVWVVSYVCTSQVGSIGFGLYQYNLVGPSSLNSELTLFPFLCQ